jgi:ABC-type multidrug transport system fused ATPase/permease subunit
MKKKDTYISLIKQLWLHINPRRKFQISILIVLMVFASLSEVISIGAILPFLGMITEPEFIFHHSFFKPVILFFKIKKADDLLLPFSLAFVIAIIVSTIMRILLLWAQTKLSFAIGGDFSFKIYQKTLYQPYITHLSRNSSDVIGGISNKVNYVIYQVLLPIFSLVSSILMISVIIFALITINSKVALVSIVGFGVIYLLIIRITKKKLFVYGEIISKESNQVIKALQEGLGGIRDVLLDGSQSTYSKIYQNSDRSLRDAQANIAIISGTPRFGIEAIGMILIVSIAYSLAISPNGIKTAIPILGSLALGAQRLLPILQQAYVNWTSMLGGEASLRDTLELLNQKMPSPSKMINQNFISFGNEIKFENITFRYSDNSPIVLKNINLTIKKGSRIGFIGTTGSGKSTFLDVVMGLIKQTSGEIIIDNKSLEIYNSREWQSKIAHVPQSIFLTDSTIAENIAFGIPSNNIDFKKVEEASKKAQIDKNIESWPLKYSTLVGERGVRLSGGQRQRIGIARALYKNADIIVFDEATSALDNDTEKEVMNAIDELGDNLTILIVAHRITTLKNCDLIVELKNGEINDVGTYDQIVNKLQKDIV